MVEKVKALFTDRVSIGFSDKQFDWLCDQVKEGKAEGIAQLIRSLVNERMDAKQ